jgi:hypothetical protein
MSEAFTLSADLRALAEWRRAIALGTHEATEAGETAFLYALDMLVIECESLEQQLAIARRWRGALDFGECFRREKAIQAGVRAGRVIDLVPVIEREMARHAALTTGGAA